MKLKNKLALILFALIFASAQGVYAQLPNPAELAKKAEEAKAAQASAQAAADAAKVAVEKEDFKRVITFGFDSDVPEEASLAKVVSIVQNSNFQQALKIPGNKFTLIGYADASGSDEYNMALSLRRAEAVKAVLVENGVDAGSITTSGKGEEGATGINDRRVEAQVSNENL